jgi:TPP-dependent pyruvate/acetoin dehydrogenase alpha subunit
VAAACGLAFCYSFQHFCGNTTCVGAQCAVGTGLALAAKYHEHGNMKIGPVPCKHVSVTMFGDGASNQVSVFFIFAMLRLTTFIFRDNYMNL